MQSKTIIIVLIAIVLVLGVAVAAVLGLGLLGFSAVAIARSEGMPPTPFIESAVSTPDYQAMGDGPAQAGDAPQDTSCSAPVDVQARDGRISYNGISFGLDPALAYTVAVETCPEGSEDPTAMPGTSHPAYTTFIFPSFNQQNRDFTPELRVYEVSSDMSGYTYPLNSLDQLKSLLELQSQSAFWYDAAPLHVRQGYLDFQDGSGARALVQYMQDVFFFTNNGLTYEFNGLTSDGRYFISLRYPVSASFLMDLGPGQIPGSKDSPVIKIPDWPADHDAQIKVIQDYNQQARMMLEQMKDSDALPDLSLLDALAGSIEVR